MVTYPKPESWHTWPHERQVEYLLARINEERIAVRRVTEHWLRAADRIKELEAGR